MLIKNDYFYGKHAVTSLIFFNSNYGEAEYVKQYYYA